jgi:hypothetical protein
MSRTRFLAAIVAVLGALTSPQPAWAQFRRVAVRPTVVRPVVGPRFFAVHNYFNPGSYLHGAAAVIDAQGRFLQSTQEAYLLREQVRAAQLDNRRRVFEQTQYERANTPTLEEQREFRRQQEFWRSWNDPPVTEIWSGKALNDLLLAVQRARREERYVGPTVPLNLELVQRINVTSGDSGSLGPLRRPDDLRWPPPLQRAIFNQERKEIDRLAPQVAAQAAAGKVDARALDSLNQAIARLRSSLRDNVRDMSSTDYIQALRFVNQLRDSGRALQSPAASTWSLTAQSVAELIDQMTQQGLSFAPVTLGDEAYYTALHRALATYASAMPLESLRDLRQQFYAISNPQR